MLLFWRRPLGAVVENIVPNEIDFASQNANTTPHIDQIKKFCILSMVDDAGGALAFGVMDRVKILHLRSDSILLARSVRVSSCRLRRSFSNGTAEFCQATAYRALERRYARFSSDGAATLANARRSASGFGDERSRPRSNRPRHASRTGGV
jgi:hypothetical protein